jgi:hypothetical protein
VRAAARIAGAGGERWRAAVLHETLRKKAFAQQHVRKKRLRKRAHVLFSAPILFARLQ